MARSMQLFVVVVSLLACIGCDQVTKAIAKEHIPRDEVLSFAYDSIRLQYAENSGAFLGLGASLPDRARGLLFTVGIGVLLCGFLAYLLFGPALSVATTLSLSLITGGGFSNLIDRVVYGGYVVDFVNVGVGGLRTGIFNIADVAIMAGAAVLIVGSVRRRQT